MEEQFINNNDSSEQPIKPDVIIDYIGNYDSNSPIALVYVRPETNEVHYEKAIILGITPYAEVVYLANLNGKIFIKDALILDHYSSQYKFCIYAKDEIRKFPEFVKRFEEHFKVDFEKSTIIGAFDALIKLNITDEMLFEIIVDERDFLRIYGQTIKKIGNIFVVNYDMPAIIKRYTPKANVFVIAVRLKDPKISFMDINQSIFEQIRKNNMVIIGEEQHKELEWNEKIKRTYHISKNNVMAMFDMLDFIIKGNSEHIGFYETPLGKILIDDYGFSEEHLYRLKEFPIVYIKENEQKKLVNLIEEANNKSIQECAYLISQVLL